MTVGSTPRLGLTTWSDPDADPPVNMAQMNDDFANLEQLVAIGAKGTLTGRPPAGVRERLYLVATGEGAGNVYWDTGTGWVQVQVTKTVVASETFAVPGEIGVASPELTIPGFFLPTRPGQSSRIVAARHRLDVGTATVDLRSNATTIAGLGALPVDQTAKTSAATSPPVQPADAYIQPVVTAVSGTPRHLTISVYVETTS